ncbi:glycoside hydrolase [Nibricoccus aquaticus]|uniref:Glycoside hydrolase n=1 Tax=Nibricoccus aquaticus TaxID=2576891 RepID=A0A290QCR5_9BACT|nr:glycoside hydrolase 43 family protein [Nibricoccus aquaticus]ATC66047.1 glycoside hydrolase [Nibricoccus aquaticus]
MMCVAALSWLLWVGSAGAATWTADNGNGTFTNPLFYEEFSDPDLIRVGEDYYLTGTTMHAMPGLPVLHSKDLVNWRLLGYVFNKLNLGPGFRLEDGKEIYGQGIWAPSFRHHGGVFHIFTNVNGQTTQHFTATNPAGPWTRTAMKCSLHDLSVYFDDDGKAYAIWGYQGIHFAELNEALDDIVPGTQRVIIEKSAGMGEGVHLYKIDGRYYITSAWFEGRMKMPCARADKITGPYEVNPAISMDEDFGLAEGNRLRGQKGPPFDVVPGNTRDGGRMSLHQGGLVQTQAGEWWGFSMMDFNSLGRLTALSPITWKDSWPYFGLEGNLKRTPRTWVKPKTGSADAGNEEKPSAPYRRNDDFSGPELANVWQWNHVPDDARWSLKARPGFLRLETQAADNFWRARNSLTQRAMGPRSVATAVLDVGGLKAGDVAGLALLNLPYAWIGVRAKAGGGLEVAQFDQTTGETQRVALGEGMKRVWLRVSCDFLTEKARFAWSADGGRFAEIGREFTMVFQLKTFQGVRYSLFAFNEASQAGGAADFDSFAVDEPNPRGLMRAIPVGEAITLTARGRGLALGVKDGAFASVPADKAARFTVIDAGLGRVALRVEDGRLVGVAGERVELVRGEVSAATSFQWTETVYGDLILMSLVTHRHLRIAPESGGISADHPGPAPDRGDGSCFEWSLQRR